MVLVWKCIRSGLYSPSFCSVGDVASVLVCKIWAGGGTDTNGSGFVSDS